MQKASIIIWIFKK